MEDYINVKDFKSALDKQLKKMIVKAGSAEMQIGYMMAYNHIDGLVQKFPKYQADFLKGKLAELSEKDFPTNREWLASLPNDKLANNLVTNPIFAESGGSIEKWLSQPCESLMEEE